MLIPLIPSINFNIILDYALFTDYKFLIISFITLLFFSKKNLLNSLFLSALTAIVIISQNMLLSIISLELMWIPLYFIEKPKDIKLFAIWWGVSTSLLMLYYSSLNPIYLILFSFLRLRLFGLNTIIGKKNLSDIFFSIAIFIFIINQHLEITIFTVILTIIITSIVFWYLYPATNIYDLAKVLIITLIFLDHKRLINLDLISLILILSFIGKNLKASLKILYPLVSFIIYYWVYKINFHYFMDRLIIIWIVFSIYFLENLKIPKFRFKIKSFKFTTDSFVPKLSFNIIPLILGIAILLLNQTTTSIYMSLALITFSYTNIFNTKQNSILIYTALALLVFEIPAYITYFRFMSILMIFIYFILEYRLKEESKIALSAIILLSLYFFISLDLRAIFSIIILLSILAISKHKIKSLVLPIITFFVLLAYRYALLHNEILEKFNIIIAGIFILILLLTIFNKYKKSDMRYLQTLSIASTISSTPILSLLIIILSPFFVSGIILTMGPLGILLRFHASKFNNNLLVLFILTVPILTIYSILAFDTIVKNKFGRFIIAIESFITIIILYFAEYLMRLYIY